MATRTANEERSSRKGFSLFRKLRNFYLDLKKEYLPRLILFVALLVVVGGLSVFLAETRLESGVFSRLFESIWWAFVTITTVG